MTRSEAARLGGLARAARLTPERRVEIAKQGFRAMVAARFQGDRKKAIEWLTAKGLAALDPFPRNGAWPDPGPMPRPEPGPDAEIPF
jgi:hypothetical protein